MKKMFRSISWFGGSILKNSKNPHSLEHLKYLHNVMTKNQVVTENNRSLLVETLRSIAEILIWGDQNDSCVFDFFLEKNMLSFFLKILDQKCGSYVCVQLLQTLNILFENIRNETSLYYLLSNNHVNSIIVHKFDFSDEEIMAYYISFLKTLSLKLNSHTIHFFYNDFGLQYTNDFPLYTEAIKFFNHCESMVRIAVRTLTLNVYRVRDTSMLRFIRNKTAVPYFSNLVWFIGNHVLELDLCVRTDADHCSQGKLSDLVAEHLDHLHYLNDILCLHIDELNDVLVDHLLNKLFIPLYIYSLLRVPQTTQESQPRVSAVVSLFLLSQVFLIIKEETLVHHLCQVLMKGGPSSNGATSFVTPLFIPPSRTLEESLKSCQQQDSLNEVIGAVTSLSITDEEKEHILAQEPPKPFFDVIVSSLDCSENDYSALFALCLLYALSTNTAIGSELLTGVFLTPDPADTKVKYNSILIEKLTDIIVNSSKEDSRVRLVSTELAAMLLERLRSGISSVHLTSLQTASKSSAAILASAYTMEDMFADMMESEDEDMRKKPLNVEWLMMDSSILLPPTGTPLTGIQFNKRLPCGQVERTRRSIRVFLLIRRLCLTLNNEQETLLPLTNRKDCVHNEKPLNLSDSDLLSCVVVQPSGVKNQRFMVVESSQIILVVPLKNMIGYGVAKLAALLNDVEVSGDKQDPKSLYISIKQSTVGPMPNTRFIFDDSIRCTSAKQRLDKGRMIAKEEKMRKIELLLEIPGPRSLSCNLLHRLRHHHTRACGSRPMVSHRIPGFATPVRVVSASPPSSESQSSVRKKSEDRGSGSESGTSSPTGKRSRESSPRLPRPRSEQIQLENISKEAGGSGAALPTESPSRETSFSQHPWKPYEWKVETV